jgi:DNA-binding MarR family transcriptional regulator
MLGTDNQLPKSIVDGVFPETHDPMSVTDRMNHPQGQNELLLYRLFRIHATAGPVIARMCEREHGITRREWRVLSCLADVEGVPSSELAEVVMLDRARTSRALTRLAEKNLVRREPKPSDRREVHVFLTEEGRRVYRALFPRIVAIQRELLAPFSAAQRAQFSELLDLLQAQTLQINPGGQGPLEDTGDEA